MTQIHETAYPRFRWRLTEAELTEMFIRSVRAIHNKGKAALDNYRARHQDRTDGLVQTLRRILLLRKPGCQFCISLFRRKNERTSRNTKATRDGPIGAKRPVEQAASLVERIDHTFVAAYAKKLSDKGRGRANRTISTEFPHCMGSRFSFSPA